MLQDMGYWILSGFKHVLPEGYDHVLFILCLFFLNRSKWFVIKAAAFFTLAHSVSLFFATIGWVNVSASIVEPIIALSIFLMALAILFDQTNLKQTYVVVFCFGLVHGLGFAGALSEEISSRQSLIATVFSFNIGVELAQMTVIALAWLLLALPFERWEGYKKWVVYPYAVIAGISSMVMFVNRL